MEQRNTILIADDAELNRSMLYEFFHEQYNTILVEDGEAALEAIKQHSDEIALVLLDLIMPRKSGFDILQYMKDRKLDGHIPVIVITGSNDYQDELRSYNLGASDIIHKPFVPQIVVRRAENVMELFAHREEMERELENAHIYDPLTGLYQMDYFLLKAEEILRRADKDGTWNQYAIVYGNVRNFKYYNLKYGFERGNQMLKKLAQKMREICPPESIHSRFGNDHFVSLVPYEDDKERQKIMGEFMEREFGSTNVKVKCGIYQISKEGENVAEACDFAKVACDTIYDRPETVCIYTDQIARKMRTENYVLEHLDDAIENGYIKVYYQPVIRTISGALCGMEALARWIDPVVGFLSPADFISVLERQHLITKLDLHMLRLVCRDMREAEANNLKLIPVSFNLSRIDLLECDIFTEVERILKEYSVPRDMINIEVTESTIAERADYIQNIIERFRGAGYQVWIDDFGSEYSSLNSLKDFQVDEIKLDMKFLSKFDDTCKKIIKSVIRMAKDLGVQTLAEGVETKEQLEFLGSVGCEKAQGYYFSKPVPLSELIKISHAAGDNVELRAWRSYYNDIGTVDFITERSLTVVEYDGKNFDYLFVNDAYRKVLAGLGTTDMNIIRQVTNSRSGALGRQLREMQKTLHKGDAPQDIIAPTQGQYIRLNFRCIAEHAEKSCYAVEITLLTSKEDEERNARFDEVYREMYGLYEAIYLYEADTGKLRTLMRGASNQEEEYKLFHTSENLDTLLAAKVFIHPNEWDDFAAFVDTDTLVARLKASERGYLVHYFRSMNANGAYTWKIHTMLYVPNGNYVVYCVRAAFFNQPGLIERVAPQYLADAVSANAKNVHHVLRQAVMESKSISIFWKDKNRRFINVNEKFLETYGFKDAGAVIGKTDEEIGWHIDADPFMDDERTVLEKGAVMTNRVGKCLIRGVNHTILANKEPMYQDGEIVGLMGSFLVVDEIEELERNNRPQSTDQITGLMGVSGISDLISEYVEGWQLKRENFAVIRISLSEYYRISKTYTEHIAKDMLHEVGMMIADTFGVQGSCARLFAGNFVILMQFRDKKEVERLCAELNDRLTGIRDLLGYPITLHPAVEIHCADEVKSNAEIIALATGGTSVDLAERKLLEEQVKNYDLQLSTVVNAIPGGIVLFEMLDEDRHKVLYASEGIAKLSGRSSEEFRADAAKSHDAAVVEADIDLLQKAVERTVHYNEPLNISYRIWHKDGTQRWVNMKGRIIGEQNDHPVLLAVFQNISEATASYEEALNEAMVGVIVRSTESNEVLYENDTAKELLRIYFDGSLSVLQQEVRADMLRQGLKPMDIEGEFQVSVKNRHFQIRISDQVWNGRDVKAIYILDITAKVREEESIERAYELRAAAGAN